MYVYKIHPSPPSVPPQKNHIWKYAVWTLLQRSKLKLLKNTDNTPCFLLHLLERKHRFAAQEKKYKACYMFFCTGIVHSSKTLHIFRQCTSTSPSPNIIRVSFWPIIKPENHRLFQKYCSSILKQGEEHQPSKYYSKHNFKQGSLHLSHLTFVLQRYC